ncbi:MAG TPA: family 78 glycoside hydrolase catalytic domain, partial [Acidobacteriota bacterium]|nr:family 78 glycoside hydrolase catalytic domain [Acidobacteriota bacterium]
MLKGDCLLTFFLILFFIIGLSQTAHSKTATGSLTPHNLRCEYLKNPMGLDVQKPRFSWMLRHSERGQKQSAYQIMVSTDPSFKKADMWDTGKVDSEQSIHRVYKGILLESNRTYYWKVRYWDKDDKSSPFSQTACFDTGLFHQENWEGEWISGDNLLRKEFLISKSIVRARAFICGLGYYELRINGKKVGNNVLDPGYTTYEKRVLYTTYDITDYLNRGQNAVGVILGKGWSEIKLLMLQINVELEGGEHLTIFTDSTWKTAQGPIIQDSIYNGEVYDARKEMPGWDRPEFNDSNWDPVTTGFKLNGKLSSQMLQPIKIMDTLLPRKMTQPEDGVYVYDFGQNFSGWVELPVSGPRGTEVQMRFAELLYENGMINQENLRSAKARDVYILKGEGEEKYEPRFTYHGFRYVELRGYPGVPRLDSLKGKLVHSSVHQIGNFSCSKPILNKLQHLITWGQKTNLHSIPTDCCQRDERMGWLGDAHLTAETAMMNFDMGAFYTKFINDIRDVQDKNGTITDTVPFIWGQRPADPAWGTAYPLLCWYMYQYYGDQRILEQHYEGLKKYADFLQSKAKNDLLDYSHYGDWVAVEPTPGSLVSSFFYAYDIVLLKNIATALGKEKEAEDYQNLAEQIKKAFHKKYHDSETRNYGSGSQTSNALPLFLNMAPEEDLGGVLHNLRQSLIYQNNTHLTTGIMGTKYVMEVLTKTGSSTLSYDLAVQTTYPSWGYMIKNG